MSRKSKSPKLYRPKNAEVEQKAVALLESLGFKTYDPAMDLLGDVSVGVYLTLKGAIRKLRKLGAVVTRTDSEIYGGVWEITTPYGHVELMDVAGDTCITFVNAK